MNICDAFHSTRLSMSPFMNTHRGNIQLFVHYSILRYFYLWQWLENELLIEKWESTASQIWDIKVLFVFRRAHLASKCFDCKQQKNKIWPSSSLPSSLSQQNWNSSEGWNKINVSKLSYLHSIYCASCLNFFWKLLACVQGDQTSFGNFSCSQVRWILARIIHKKILPNLT